MKMYAEKYELLQLHLEEKAQLQSALVLSKESARIRNEAFDSMRVAANSANKATGKMKIALTKEGELHGLTKDKLKKKNKIIIGLGILSGLLLILSVK